MHACTLTCTMHLKVAACLKACLELAILCIQNALPVGILSPFIIIPYCHVPQVPALYSPQSPPLK